MSPRKAWRRARLQGATDLEIHDTVLIAAAFCMYNRYVDGLATWQPRDPAMYSSMGEHLATHGYLTPSYKGSCFGGCKMNNPLRKLLAGTFARADLFRHGRRSRHRYHFHRLGSSTQRAPIPRVSINQSESPAPKLAPKTARRSSFCEMMAPSLCLSMTKRLPLLKTQG